MNTVATSVALLLAVAAGDGSNAQSPSTGSRQLCGPIAVQTVLRHFGKDLPLPELTDEVFGASTDRFSSMAALDDCLRNHGVYTAAMEVAKDHRIDWHGPVIVHFPPSSPNSGGHFAVMLPSESGSRDPSRKRVSFSPGTSVLVPWRKLSAARSSIVLLTSDRAINIERSRIAVARGDHWDRAALISCVGLFVVVFFCSRSMERVSNEDVSEDDVSDGGSGSIVSISCGYDSSDARRFASPGISCGDRCVGWR